VSEALDPITGSLDTAMVIVTAAAQGQRAGCLVGFHCQSSMDPPRWSFWLSKANHTYRVGLHASSFAMHFLDEQQKDYAERFGSLSGEDTDKFEGVRWRPGEDGVPLLSDFTNRVELRRVALLDDGGDHVCVTGAVHAVTAVDGFEPLRLSQVLHLRPGHGNEERAPI
jgi:flavin reductase (DIM6/NTAB) family NADH-FMN oxidoreductase RutF